MSVQELSWTSFARWDWLQVCGWCVGGVRRRVSGWCKQYTSNTAKFYEKWLRRKQSLRWRAMRTSVRRTTASSQTTSGMWTRTTTCSSPSTTPMTMLTSTIAWCTSCVERARRAHSSTPGDVISHLIWLKFWAVTLSSPCHPWRVLFDSISPFFLYFSFLSFSVYFLHSELFLELDNPTVMASLRYSAAEESEDTLNSFTSHTYCEHVRQTGNGPKRTHSDTPTSQSRVYTERERLDERSLSG